MAIVSMIHPVHIVRYPPGVRFDAYQFQLGMTLEDAAQDEGADNVLASANDRQEAVELGAASLEIVRAAGEDMKAERQLHIHRRFVKGIVDRALVVLERWFPAHHDDFQPERPHPATS